jgi:hypothetical protein
MKYINKIGPVLVTILMITATATSVAAASAPEFVPSTTQKFTFKSGTSKLSAPGEIKITCEKSTGKGEINGAKTVANIGITYTGCKGKKKTESECSVKSPESSVAGTITTEKIKTGKLNPLSGELGNTTIGTKVGLALKSTIGEVFSEIEGTCIFTTMITGSVIGEVTPINLSQLTAKAIFRAAPPGSDSQQIKSCSGGTVIILCNGENDTLEAFGGPTAWEAEVEITFTATVKIT